MRRRRAAVVLTGLAAVGAAVGVAMWEPSPLLPIADPDALPPFAVARIGKARFGGLVFMSPIAWTPDSREIVALSGSRIRVFDASTGLVAREFDATIEDPNATAASLTERAMRWFGRPVPTKSFSFEEFELSHDGRYVAIGTQWGPAVFDLATGTRLAERPMACPISAQIAFTADDRALLVAADDGLHCWDFRTGEDRVCASSSPVTGVVVSATQVYAGLGNELVEIGGGTLAVLRRTTIDPGPVARLSCSPNGEWLAVLTDTIGSEGIVLATSDLSRTTIPVGRIDGPEWLGHRMLRKRTSPNGRLVADGGKSRLRVTNAHADAPVPAEGTIDADDFAVLSDSRTLAVIDARHRVGLFDLRTGTLARSLPTDAVRYSGRLVADSVSPHVLVPCFPPQVWDTMGAAYHVASIPILGRVLSLHGSKAVWLESHRDRVQLHDTTGAEPTCVEFRGEASESARLAYSAARVVMFDCGRHLATADIGASLRLWDCTSGTSTVPAWSPSRVQGFAGAADADLLAVGDAAGWSIRETATGTELRRFPTSMHGAGAAAFAPGAQRVALSDGAEILVADIASGSTLRLGRHAGDIELLAFTPDGSLLVSGSDDGTILVWDLATAAAAAAPR